MILGLAKAIEPAPFHLKDAASYLRDWVTEKLTLVPALDVSILTTSRPPSGVVEPLIGGGQVSALEPGVSTVRVERSSTPTLGEVHINPRMEVICGIAKSLHTEGCDWTVAIQKGYELWEKLNPNVVAALGGNRNNTDVSQGNVQPGALVSADPEDQDDQLQPMELELDDREV